MGWEREQVAKTELLITPEEIVGKERPRFNAHQCRTYTPDKTKDAEAEIAWAWRSKYGGKFRDFDGIVEMTVSYWRRLAKSNPRKWEGKSDTSKPDVDNVLKLVMDALEGVAYRDDKQVTIATIAKGERTRSINRNFLRIRITYYKETFTKE